MTSPAHQEKIKDNSSTTKLHVLLLHNDDINSFDHVTDCLIEILDFTYEQAFQCALIVHNKGVYDVKEGVYKELSTYKTLLIERGLSVSIKNL